MTLNVLTLDNPYPPDYGGAIDLYYKLIALKNCGVDINLFYFAKPQRLPISEQLKSICKTIIPLKRLSYNFSVFSISKPYAVISRKIPSQHLEQLLAYPILFDGLQTTHILNKTLSKTFKHPLLLRMHNVESLYYRELSQYENPGFRKLFFAYQSKILEDYEKKIVPQCSKLLAISTTETAYFSKMNPNTRFLPAFIGDIQNGIALPEEITNIIYTANFSVKPNLYYLNSLIRYFSTQNQYKLTIAGKAIPTKFLKQRYSNITFINNPIQVNDIYASADVILCPQVQASGVKLKVLMALKAGKVVLGTPQAFTGIGFDANPLFFTDFDDLESKFKAIESRELDQTLLNLHAKFTNIYNDHFNAQMIIHELTHSSYANSIF